MRFSTLGGRRTPLVKTPYSHLTSLGVVDGKATLLENLLDPADVASLAELKGALEVMRQKGITVPLDEAGNVDPSRLPRKQVVIGGWSNQTKP